MIILKFGTIFNKLNEIAITFKDTIIPLTSFMFFSKLEPNTEPIANPIGATIPSYVVLALTSSGPH
jgi:hypothetical protein